MIIGKGIFQLQEFEDAESFIRQEKQIILKFNPYYLQCVINAHELKKIHEMEDAGFRFVEIRYKKQLDIYAFHKISELAFFPYIIELIQDKETFAEALELVKKGQSDDRFSLDPLINSKLSKKRLTSYIRKSYNNYPVEFIWSLFNKNTNEILAIKSGEILQNDEIFFYHTAIKEGLDIEKYTYMIDSLIISNYIKRGFNIFYSVTSGFNRMEMDLSISSLKYKLVSASVILRKIYK